jgi:succinate dehydrogenase / fumarate reductase flavoprotein subunit
MSIVLDSKIPSGPLEQKWSKHKMDSKLINPANKRKYTDHRRRFRPRRRSRRRLARRMGYQVKCFCYQDSPRRAHSIAAQGGINAAKNYQNDGDSVRRLFYDTIKGGDFRAREANVYRLAEVSNADHRPMRRPRRALRPRIRRPARQPLVRRLAGFPHLLRPRPDRTTAPHRLLSGARKGNPQGRRENVFPHRDARPRARQRPGQGHRRARPRHRQDQQPRGRRRHPRHRRLRQRVLPFHQRDGLQRHRAWRAAKRGALFANPCYTQIHPTCIPVSGDYQSKLTLMSESLRNDGRIWVPKSKEVAEKLRKKQMSPNDVAEDDRDYYLERKYPSFGNLSPRDISSRAAKEACDDGRGIAPTGLGVYLDFRDATKRLGEETSSAPATATSSRCMKRSPARILTRAR